jgi:alpha-beta hydrolase superfamily lysophospholipase
VVLGVAGLLAFVLAAPQVLLLIGERQAFVTPPAGAERPDEHGAPATAISFASGDRILRASWVAADAANGPALAIFHGDEEDISRWARVQAHLHRAGIASFVFDYSGYGASTGTPSVARLRQDALAAWDRFVALTPGSRRRVALGFSLGSAVLADAAPRMQPAPHALVMAAGFASAREAAVATGRVPGWVAWMLPDLWNSEAALKQVQLPLLVVHSRADEVFAVDHAVRLCRAAAGPCRLVVVDALRHDAPLDPAGSVEFWDVVIDAVRPGTKAPPSTHTPGHLRSVTRVKEPTSSAPGRRLPCRTRSRSSASPLRPAPSSSGASFQPRPGHVQSRRPGWPN